MKPGRNDPCPCGSGKKYKHCCADRDAKATPALRLLGQSTMHEVLAATRASVRPGTPWEGDLIPLPGGGVESDPTARPAVLLLAADGRLLHAEVVSHPPAEPEDVAGLVASTVDQLISGGAAAPSAIRIRHRGVAAALSARLAGRGIKTRYVRELPVLEAFASIMRQKASGDDEPVPAVSMPHAWAAWGLPNETIAELFAAAAAFHEVRPWTHLENEELLRLDLPTGATWMASLLGNAGAEFGLVLYEDEDDFFCLFTADTPGEAFEPMRSAVLSLTFSARGDLPAPMRREVDRAGWKVAGPRAYPVLFTLNTPGGGITRTQVSELIAALGAIAQFATTHASTLAGSDLSAHGSDWRDEATGAVVHYEGRPEGEIPSLWPVPTLLAASLPEGANADVRAVVDAGGDLDELGEREHQVVDRFAASLRDAGATAKRTAHDVDNARFFVDAMTGYQGVPLAAVTEYDLRVFLYDWFPRKVMSSRTAAMTIRASLRRFFAFLAKDEGIAYPWAEPILRDKAGYEERWDSFPGGHWWNEDVREWQGELYADLGARVMLPVRTLADVGEWGETMGLEEARLFRALQREWLIWRDEVIRGGITEPAVVRAELVVRQHAWEREPHPRRCGVSAIEVVARERAERNRGGRPPI